MKRINILIVAASILIMNKITAQDTVEVPGKKVRDTDCNVYNSVIIGKQIWMKENLKVTRFNDNTLIPMVTDSAKWANLKTPGYCWYENDSSIIKTDYGALYNWYAVNTGKLCPAGWHVPTDNDWSILVTYLGGDNVAGGKLKEVGRTHWKTTNLFTTNSTNFTAIPGGYRDELKFRYFGAMGVWWTSTEISTEKAWYRHVNNYLGVGNYVESKAVGFSIRCLKD